MPASTWFWVVFLLWLLLGIFGVWLAWPLIAGGHWVPSAGAVLLIALLALLGWKSFGPPVKGG